MAAISTETRLERWHSSSGLVEWWSGGVVEWWSGGVRWHRARSIDHLQNEKKHRDETKIN
jgi:hypothetical protein